MLGAVLLVSMQCGLKLLHNFSTSCVTTDDDSAVTSFPVLDDIWVNVELGVELQLQLRNNEEYSSNISGCSEVL